MTLRERLSHDSRPPLFHTLVPPPQPASGAELDAVASTLERLMGLAALDAVHVPQVRPDPRSPRRRFVPKLAPRAFAQAMARRLEDSPDWLIDRGVTDHHWEQHDAWLRRTVDRMGLSSILLVGGASRGAWRPGPSVDEAARRIRRAYGREVTLAAVAIPTRADEADRLAAKAEAGIDLFVTQILGEADSTRQLLVDYHRACRDRGLLPRPLVLSVAPVGQRRDVEFLEAWGVRFDPRWRRHLMSSALGVGWRSIEFANELLTGLFDFAQTRAPDLPLGVNVEHVRPHSLELSGELLRAVADKWS